jgi:hypothetical protein
MFHPEECFAKECFTVVILCQGRVVRLLGRGYSLSLALALLRSAGRAAEPDGVPAMVRERLDDDALHVMPQGE